MLPTLTDAERYALIVENSGDVVFQSVGGVLEWISPSVSSLLGWTAADLVGRTSDYLLHPDDLDAVGELRDYSRSQVPGREVCRLRHRDGHYLWAEITTRPYLDAGGGFGATGSLRDVTQQVSAELELAQAERTLSAILRQTPSSIIVVDPVRDEHGAVCDFVVDRANPAACRFEELDEHEVVGSSVGALRANGLADDLAGLLEEVLRSGEAVEIEDRLVPPSAPGPARYADVRAFSIGHAVTLTWRDATERHVVTAELARSRREYKLLAENASDVVLRCTVDGDVEWVSDSVADLTGWVPEDLLGVGILELVHPDDRESLEVVRGGLLRGIPATLNVRIRQRDGRYRWVSALIRSILDEAGAATGLVSGWRDIDRQVSALREAADLREHHAMLQFVSTEVVVLEVEGQVRWVSNSVERLLGWAPDELVGRSTELLWDPRDDDGLEQQRRAARDGETSPAVCRLKDVRGDEVWALVESHGWVTGDDEDGVALTISDYRPMHAASKALLTLQNCLDARGPRRL